MGPSVTSKPQRYKTTTCELVDAACILDSYTGVQKRHSFGHRLRDITHVCCVPIVERGAFQKPRVSHVDLFRQTVKYSDTPAPNDWAGRAPTDCQHAICARSG